MALISIIVPVYKVEKYLDKCIKSLLEQTINNFELILVDDGSPDRSGDICEHYAQLDKRIKVIHKKNGGLSDARNVGIDASKGKYIGFVDSDDYVDADMFETLFNNIIEYEAEIAACGIYLCYENVKIPRCNDTELILMNTEEAINSITKIFSGVTNKLFKKEIFENLRFPVGKTNEDAFIIIDILESAKSIVFNPISKYYYIQRENSILNSQKFDTRMWDGVEAWGANLEYVKSYYPNSTKAVEYKYLASYVSMLDHLIIMQNFKTIDELKEIKAFIRRNLIKVYRNPYFIFNRKLALTFFLVYPPLYKKAVLLIKNKRELVK